MVKFSRLVSLGLLIAILGSCASIPVEERYGAEDPFSRQLDYYYIERRSGQRQLKWAVIGLVSSIAASSLAATGSSLGWYDDSVRMAAQASGYALSTGFSVWGYYGYRKWSDASENYIETLRLQSQYYNLVY